MRILLVDDEFLARNAVMLLLKNAQLPSLLMYEAVNGREAIEKILQCKPDIVLIDISMPLMNGIELLGWIGKNMPDIYCVVLSSYPEFEYVRDAMKLGAKDYLLKHQLTQEALMAMLRQSGRLSGDILDKEGGRERDLDAFLRGADASAELPWVKECFFFTLTLPPGEKGRNAQGIMMTCRHALEGEGAVVVMPKANKLAFAFPADGRVSQPQQKKNLMAARRMLADALERYHNIDAAFTELTLIRTAEEMHRDFSGAAVPAPEHLPFQGKAGSVIELENGLITAVLHNHQISIERLIRRCFENGPSKSEVQNALEMLLSRCCAMLLKQEAPPSEKEAGEEYYIQMFAQLARQYQHKVYSGFAEIIRKTIVYINSNSHVELTLTQIADEMSINYSYLSFLFKKETGIGINQYINALRVSNAMRLILLDDISMADVSARVGFNSYNHFVAAFKGVVGLSPNSLRKHPGAFAYMMEFSPIRPARLEKSELAL